MKLNKHYSELNESYLFSTIAHKVAAYQKANPDKDIIRLGIGDVTLPLAKSVTDAMLKAVEEQGKKETFHGYIPSEQGYEFLRSAIQKYYAGTAWSWTWPKSLYPTAPRATWATCWICLMWTIPCWFRTPFTPFMWMTT